MSLFRYQRVYQGKIKGVILDWAGTTLDYGCMAPAVAFQKVFESSGVPVTIQEAREPMGTHKKDHIRLITRMASVRARWKERHGCFPEETDVDRMFREFIPLQLESMAEFSTLIPGTLELVDELRKRNCKIGTTTGYTGEMMSLLCEMAEKQGYRPDCVVCASDVPGGRPEPFMILQNMISLGLSPVESCVKIDDTTPGIEEGLNAGCWTIGLALSGNDVGMRPEQWNSLDSTIRKNLRNQATEKHLNAGAHYVVDSIKDVLPVLEDIESRLARGEKP